MKHSTTEELVQLWKERLFHPNERNYWFLYEQECQELATYIRGLALAYGYREPDPVYDSLDFHLAEYGPVVLQDPAYAWLDYPLDPTRAKILEYFTWMMREARRRG